MPALPFVPNVLKLEVTGTLGPGEFTNIFHVGGSTSPWTVSQVEAAVSHLNSTLGYIYTNDGGTDLSVTELVATDLTSDTSPRVVSTPGWTGSRSGISAPASSCVLVAWGVSRRWRGGHPRTYFPLGDAALMENSTTWDTAFITQVAADVASFIEAIYSCPLPAGSSPVPVAISYYTGGALRTTPVIDVITSESVRPRICSQRRRLGKIGG